MDVVYPRCAGIDISKADMKVCVRVPGPSGRQRREVRTFSTMTADLLVMRDWLMDLRISVVGMEATGDYWKPVFYLLEHDMDCWLLNAGHMKAVPGRKTDVKDAEWICQLVEHGLVRPSFVPPEPIRQLRDLTRYRTEIVREPGSRPILSPPASEQHWPCHDQPDEPCPSTRKANPRTRRPANTASRARILTITPTPPTTRSTSGPAQADASPT